MRFSNSGVFSPTDSFVTSNVFEFCCDVTEIFASFNLLSMESKRFLSNIWRKVLTFQGASTFRYKIPAQKVPVKYQTYLIYDIF